MGSPWHLVAKGIINIGFDAKVSMVAATVSSWIRKGSRLVFKLGSCTHQVISAAVYVFMLYFVTLYYAAALNIELLSKLAYITFFSDLFLSTRPNICCFEEQTVKRKT